MYLLDTSAWIEFFIKSAKGEKVKRHLETKNCYTSIVSVSEISNWAIKNKLDGRELTKHVMGLTQVLDLNVKVAFLAGELNFQRKHINKNWGMLDSFILSTSQIYNLRILTKDMHFSDLQNAEIL